MAYSLTNNSPSAGFISWSSDTKIVYNGTVYAIAGGNSNKRYVWWQFAAPTVFQEADAWPAQMTVDDAVVFVNRNGMGISVLDMDYLDGGSIAEGTVDFRQLAVGSIRADHIAAGAITASHIATASITADNMQINSIKAENITAGAITAEKIDVRDLFAQQIAINGINGFIKSDNFVKGSSGFFLGYDMSQPDNLREGYFEAGNAVIRGNLTLTADSSIDPAATIAGVSASNVANTYTNTANFQNTGNPTNAPVVPSGSTITFTALEDGSMSVPITWTLYVDSTIPADYLLLLWANANRPTVLTDNQVYIPKTATTFTLTGLPASGSYSFGLVAVRNSAQGAKYSPITSPSASPDWQGITALPPALGSTATINGTGATAVTSTVTNTSQYQSSTSPTNAPSITSVERTRQNDGSVTFSLVIPAYTQGAARADALVIYWAQGNRAVTTADTNAMIPVTSTSFLLEGMPATVVYSFGISAIRAYNAGTAINGPINHTNWQNIGNNALGTYFIPSATLTPASTGLFLESTYMGYYQTTGTPGWRTYLDSSGRMYLKNPTGNQGVSWDGSQFLIGDATKTDGYVSVDLPSYSAATFTNANATITGLSGLTVNDPKLVGSLVFCSVAGIAAGVTVVSNTATVITMSANFTGTTGSYTASFSKVVIKGKLYSTAGTIGGFTLGATSLIAGSGVTRVSLSTADGIHLGHDTFASAPFRVTPAGALTATSATITGDITATSGAIGGITVASGKLYTGNGLFATNDGLYMDSTGQFALKDKLKWDGANLTVNGRITVDSTGSSLPAATITGTLVASQIGAGSIHADKLSVLARSVVNNPVISGNINGWGPILEDGSGTSTVVSYNSTEKVLRIASATTIVPGAYRSR
jgi:hypothetical protein